VIVPGSKTRFSLGRHFAKKNCSFGISFWKTAVFELIWKMVQFY